MSARARFPTPVRGRWRAVSLALEIVAERLRLTGVQARELRFDLIGVDSILGRKLSADAPEPREVRVRVVGRTDSLGEAARIG